MADPIPQPPPPAPAPSGVGKIVGGVVIGVVATLLLIGGVAYYALRPVTPQPEPIVITIDPTTPPHVGRIVNIHAETSGGLVKWQMLTAPSDKWDIRYSGTNQHDIYFATPISGDFRLQAVTVVGGEADVTEIHVLVDVAPIPPGPVPPGPIPPNPGPIPAGALRVLMTFDEDTYPNDQAAQKVLNDTSIRNYIRAHGQGKFVSNKVQFTDEPEMKPWKDAFQKQKQLGITIFNGQNGVVSYEGPLPKTVDETMKLLQQYGGQ